MNNTKYSDIIGLSVSLTTLFILLSLYFYSTSALADYARSDWGRWKDLDHDCMNTRHEILQDQADAKVVLSENGCTVKSSTWFGPFSRKLFTNPRKMDVDHIVPLKWAYDHGAKEWTKDQKITFANDPVNLLAVDLRLNRSKGAKGPDKWMPPNEAFKCPYLKIWDTVLKKYPLLKMTEPESVFFKAGLKQCNDKKTAFLFSERYK